MLRLIVDIPRKKNGPDGLDHRYDANVPTHGVIDPSVSTTQRGIWAIKWSLFGWVPLFADRAADSIGPWSSPAEMN